MPEDTQRSSQPRYARIRGVCQILDCGPSFVHRLVQTGRLTPRRVGPRYTVYSIEEVRRLIESTAKDSAPTEDAA